MAALVVEVVILSALWTIAVLGNVVWWDSFEFSSGGRFDRSRSPVRGAPQELDFTPNS
jgi:hypothetical protein